MGHACICPTASHSFNVCSCSLHHGHGGFYHPYLHPHLIKVYAACSWLAVVDAQLVPCRGNADCGWACISVLLARLKVCAECMHAYACLAITHLLMF